MNQPQPQPAAWRVARCVRRQLQILADQRLARVHEQTHMAATRIERIERLSRLLGKARRRGWHGAARQVIRRLRTSLPETTRELSALTYTFDRLDDPPIPGWRDLFDELNHLADEFGGYTFVAASRTLSVTTEPIELEDVYLGPFEIELDLGRLADVEHRAPYRIIAVDPHPATGNESVTHPHVSQQQLCAGEAVTSIRAALLSGRIADFCLLVRAVLANYNPESPYVELADWQGVLCEDCGGRVHEDERIRCEHCETVACNDCTQTCASCGYCFCGNCVSLCPNCEEDVCTHCTAACIACRRRVCIGCLDDQRCPDCTESEQPDETTETEPQEGSEERPSQPQVCTSEDERSRQRAGV